MPKQRGSEHTTLTETAQEVVRILDRSTEVKMIAPGIIKTNARSSRGKRYVTAAFTSAGMELIITGQSVQKVSVHTNAPEAVFAQLQNSKKLQNFVFKQRERKPGI